MTCGAGGASARTVRAATPKNSWSVVVGPEAQCRSVSIVVPGSAETSSKVQEYFSPEAVAPKTWKFHRSRRNLGTGP